MSSLRQRRTVVASVVVAVMGVIIAITPDVWNIPAPEQAPSPRTPQHVDDTPVLSLLEELPVKGRAPRTGYARAQFGSGWTRQQGCDMRNIVLARDLTATETNEKCQVTKGHLSDPYTGAMIIFERGADSSQAVQIDHVVALSNAWQTGAQQLDEARRVALANDPLNLLAVDGSSNQAKGDGDAATWLPPNKPFRCQYVARQVAVKHKYNLWVVAPEKEAIKRVLAQCPAQPLPQA